MKTKYNLNDQYQLVSYDLVPDDYEPQGFETCVIVPEGLYEPVTFNPTKQTWTGLNYEDWAINHPGVPVTPSPEMLAINALGLQVAKLMAEKEGA